MTLSHPRARPSTTPMSRLAPLACCGLLAAALPATARTPEAPIVIVEGMRVDPARTTLVRAADGTVALRLPDRRAFTISPEPAPGARLAGEFVGSRLVFAVGGVSVRVRADARFQPGTASVPAYVREGVSERVAPRGRSPRGPSATAPAPAARGEAALQSEVARLRTDVTRLAAERERLADAQRQRAADGTRLQQQVAELQAEVAALAQEREALARDRDAVANDRARLRAEQSALREQIEALDRRLAQTDAERRQLVAALADALDEREALAREFEAARRRAADAEQRAAAMRTGAQADRDGVRTALREAEADRDRLRAALVARDAAADAFAAERTDRDRQIRALQDELARVRASRVSAPQGQLAAEADRLRGEADRLRADAARLADELAEVRGERDRLAELSAVAPGAPADADLSALRASLAALQTDLAAAQADLAGTREALRASEQARADLADEAARLGAEVQRLNGALLSRPAAPAYGGDLMPTAMLPGFDLGRLANADAIRARLAEIEYPRWAALGRIQGDVLVLFQTDAAGRVIRTAVPQELGGGLDDLAEALVREMVFVPVTVGGQPTGLRSQVVVRFGL